MHIIELITFRRKTYENIDDAFNRFDSTRARAGTAQGFSVPYPAFAWLFLKALRVPRPAWPLLLQACGGTLPQDEATLNILYQYIRQQGHFSEHTMAGPSSLHEGMKENMVRSHYYGDEVQPNQDPWSTLEQSMGHATEHVECGVPVETTIASSYYLEENYGWTYCKTCHSYLYDGERSNENDTDSDSEVDYSMCIPKEVQECYGEGADAGTPKEEHLYSTRRYRRVMKKEPRRQIFPRKNRSVAMRSKGRGNRITLAKTQSSGHIILAEAKARAKERGRRVPSCLSRIREMPTVKSYVVITVGAISILLHVAKSVKAEGEARA